MTTKIIDYVFNNIIDFILLAFIIYLCIRYWDKIRPMIIKLKNKIQERRIEK